MNPSNRDADARALLRACFDAAVAAAQPQQVLAAHLPPPPKGRTVVVGAGKAAGAMAHALELAWPRDAALSGCVVTRYGHTPPRPEALQGLPERIAILEAAHPVPDAASAVAAERMLAAVHGLSEGDLVIALISGGASALLTAPAPPVSLADKQAIFAALLASGAAIDEMNTVRKHLSRIKGGRLALACGAAPVLSLVISDVPGDSPAVIASGPTVADDSTCAQALAVLDRHHIPIASALRHALQTGALESPKPADFAARTQDRVQLIATPWQSLQAAAELARARGWAVHILGDALEGEARALGRTHLDLAKASLLGHSSMPAPCLFLSGGEATVRMQGMHARSTTPANLHTARADAGAADSKGASPASGGRSGEFCLGVTAGMATSMGDSSLSIWALAADTDGIDGSSPHAGAFVTPDTLQRAQQLGLSLAETEQAHDSHGFFGQLGDLLSTGPTHTNVNDFRALLVWP